MDDRTEKGKQGIMMNSKNQYIIERIKEDLNKWKNIPCSGTERLNIIKMVILPKQTYRFNTTPVRIPAEFFVQIDKLILKFIWNCKGSRIVKIILKMNKEGCTLSEFKTCYEVLVIEAVWYWHMDRHTEQWNRNASPEINLFVYGQLIFDKDTKIIQWERTVFSTNDAGTTGQPVKITLISHQTQKLTKMNQRHKCKSITKLLGKNTGIDFHDLGFGKGSFDMTPKARATKEQIN